MAKVALTDLTPLMVARYEDLTATEIIGNVQWFRLSSNRQFNEAFRVLQVALDVEHFIATMPLDPNDFTQPMIDEVKELRNQLTAISGIFCPLNLLGETTKETNRQLVANLVSSIPNDPDATV